jgi:hypothetical protein
LDKSLGMYKSWMVIRASSIWVTLFDVCLQRAECRWGLMPISSYNLHKQWIHIQSSNGYGFQASICLLTCLMFKLLRTDFRQWQSVFKGGMLSQGWKVSGPVNWSPFWSGPRVTLQLTCYTSDTGNFLVRNSYDVSMCRGGTLCVICITIPKYYGTQASARYCRAPPA